MHSLTPRFVAGKHTGPTLVASVVPVEIIRRPGVSVLAMGLGSFRASFTQTFGAHVFALALPYLLGIACFVANPPQATALATGSRRSAILRCEADGIGGREFMSMLTVCFCGVDCSRASTAQCIFSGRDSFEMGRIATRSVSAEMVQFGSFWNYPDQLFVGGTMHKSQPSQIPAPAIPIVRLAGPFPAPFSAVKCGKAFRKRHALHSHAIAYPLTMSLSIATGV